MTIIINNSNARDIYWRMVTVKEKYDGNKRMVGNRRMVVDWIGVLLY
jgi:hypothetical protein